jgi:regulator of protease activity HflC (stomatin/prohibitin superfamily)
MKKELRNVLRTFALIGVVSFGVSQFYAYQTTQLAFTGSVVEHSILEIESELDRIYAERLAAEQQELLRIKAAELADLEVKEAAEKAQKATEAKALADAKNAAEARAIQEVNAAAEAARPQLNRRQSKQNVRQI